MAAAAAAAETRPAAPNLDDGLHVAVPRHVIQEILADGCCPLQLRLQLQVALAREGSAHSLGQRSDVQAPGTFWRGDCAGMMASFLELGDFLVARAAGPSLLCAVMQPDPGNQGALAAPSADPLDDPTAASALELLQEPQAGEHAASGWPPRAQAAGVRGSAEDVRDRLRVRLWMSQISKVSAGTSDERLFEIQAKRFWEDALRRRLEDEVADAKHTMEEEVRVAKANMLECVQSISDEVDARVHSKVADLQHEFDRRAAEQVRGLQDMVERRVHEQTAALQAEVDRRTDIVRAAVEQRSREQELAALRLQVEVARMRSSLEARVREQEEVAARLGAELARLRLHVLELTETRDKLEARLQEGEAAGATVGPQERKGGTSLCFPWMPLRRRHVRQHSSATPAGREGLN